MKKRVLSLVMAVCMLCILTMTSCSAAEIPDDETSGTELLAAETEDAAAFSDVPADAWYGEPLPGAGKTGS